MEAVCPFLMLLLHCYGGDYLLPLDGEAVHTVAGRVVILTKKGKARGGAVCVLLGDVRLTIGVCVHLLGLHFAWAQAFQHWDVLLPARLGSWGAASSLPLLCCFRNQKVQRK